MIQALRIGRNAGIGRDPFALRENGDCLLYFPYIPHYISSFPVLYITLKAN